MKATKMLSSLFSISICLAMLLSLAPIHPAEAVSDDIVISQVYGGGGNSGATLKYDFVELYNRGSDPVSVDGWSLQYTSPTGSGNFGATESQITPLPNLTMAPGTYLLIQGAQGTGGTADLPWPDVTDPTPLSMGGTAGKVVLVTSPDPLGCNGSSTPCDPTQLSLIKDLVGWGTANFYEGTSAAPGTTNTTSVLRKSDGAQDTDDNGADFDTGSPLPRNSVYPFDAVGLATPNSVLPGESTLLTVTVTPAGDSTGITVSADLTPIGGNASQTFYDDGTHGDVADSDNTFSFSAVVGLAIPSGANTLFATASDLQGRTTHTNISLMVGSVVTTPIADARAAGDGWSGSIQGNVTVVPGKINSSSFAIQDATGGIYVYYPTPPSMELGDLVRMEGTIDDYSGLLEFTSISNFINLGSGTPPEPTPVATGSVGNTQGLLVQLEGTVTYISPGTGNKTIDIDDGSGEATVYIYTSRTGIDTTGITPGVKMRIIGFSYNYSYTPEVTPRYQSDLYIFPPEVTSTYPEDGAVDVNLYRPLTATFDHAMDELTINDSSFILENEGGPVSGLVSYDDSSNTATFTPDSILSESTLYTATLTTDIKDIYDISFTPEYTWTFTSGVIDTTAPSIVGKEPAESEADVPLNSNVTITFSEDLDPSTISQSDFNLEGPFGDVPFKLSYDPITFAVTLNPDLNLLPSSEYIVTVSTNIDDWAGNSLIEGDTWSFTTTAEQPMQVFLGDIHNHTSISDGSGTPAQALAAGKAAGYDFMALTDHSYSINDTEWESTLSAVNAATVDDEFIAIRGFEYTQGAEGHINVYNTERHAVRTDTTNTCTYCDYTPNLEAGSTVEGFYEWAASEGMNAVDDAGTVLQFNHPGWINFNDWAYHPEVSDIAKLEEVGNGNGSSYAFSEDQYIRSLDYGWKLGATNNADTHTADWGTNTDHRTGVLMTELTKDALLEALNARRTYATEDKNFALTMKANGAWMGSEIPNSGSVEFEITGSDPDDELTSLVQIITDQGVVAAAFYPNTADFSLDPVLDITTGVHYFYVKVTQADGDRIVSSPVWTMGSEDISITDLTIQPTIPTIYNSSLLEVRVTNRNSSPRTVDVSLDVNGTPLGSPIEVIVPGNGDALASFSWQPSLVGDATVTASISGAPAEDNPDDNQASLELTVTDEQVPLILIDAGKNNLNATGNEMRMFIDDLSNHGYNVLKNLDELTAADLNPAIVKLLLITAPETAYSGAELAAIGDYVDAGGNLWLVGTADYDNANAADFENAILDAIETSIGSDPINMRFNDDEIVDGNDNNGYPWGVYWHSFPISDTTGIGMNVEKMTSWSVVSLRGRDAGTPLTADAPGIDIVVQGDLDPGYTGDSYHNPLHTSNEDADEQGDAYIYNPAWVYPAEMPLDAIPVPMAAITQLPNGAGRILLSGDSNDAFTTYAYTAGDGLQNETFNLEAVMWLMGEPLQKSSIAEARVQVVDDQPVNLNKLVWVEGEITAAYGEFFNMLYVQDETGGIAVHAPAGDIDPSAYTRGTKVRVVGTVGIYNGDTEIEFFEAEMVQVIEPGTEEPLPLPMTTHQASLEDSQGWLTIITGTVTSKVGVDTIFVNDGSGSVRVFLDGYNGDFSDIEVHDLVQVTGLVSEDGGGGRIRVRNHYLHPEYADDVIYLGKVPYLAYFPIIGK
jgi:uncharacterized protein YdeI (BOF family)